MFRKQSFWKGSALLLASAMIAKLLGACFKIPLTNVLGGTGMGYFSTAYGLLLPVYALSVTGLSAAVAQTVSRAAALEHWAEVRRIRDTARLACGVLGLFLSLCMFLLAEPFAALVAAQPYALFSLLAIAPAALFGCLTAVERGYWEGLQNMTPTAVSQALEAVAKLGLGLALCQWVLAHPEIVCRRVPADVPLSALAAAGAVLGVTLSTAVGWLYFLLRGLRSGNRLPRGNAPAAPMGQIFRRLLYVMIPVALGSLVTNLTSLLDLVTMMRCLGRAQMLHSGELLRRFGTAASAPDFPAFVYGSFTGMAITVFNLVPSVTNMLGKSALPCAAALWAKQDREGVVAHIRSVTGAAAAMALPAAGGLWALAEPVMHILYAGRPEEAAIAARGAPHAAPRYGLPLSHLSALQHFAGRRESRRSGGMYAGRGRRETPGQPSADSTPGVLHHRRRDRHIIVLPGAVGTDPVAAATLSGKAAASNANPAAHCACSRVLYGGGVVLPGTDGCAGNAALCGGGSGRRLSGISGGTVSAGAAPAETDSQYTIK